MNEWTRRRFLQDGAVLGLGAMMALNGSGQETTSRPKRKMTMDLVCGAIGVSASQTEALELAGKYGFESVGADASFLASISSGQLSELQSGLKSKSLVFGAANLPLEFRQTQDKFDQGLKELPRIAAGLERAGVQRISTWLTPCDAKLTFIQNFRQHATRLRAAALILKDHGLRLGLEYVGPKTAWASRRYPFIHTLAEMQDLVAEINTGNVGFLLDSWHWYNAGDSIADLLNLKPAEVIAVDLNDAPAGVPKDQQVDSRRELPCATGVIDVAGFLNALNQIGYDGPVRAEPFNQALTKLSKDEACAATASAMKKAFALIA